MYSLLLVIIYVAFISLGLPDSLIGSAWPVMQQDLNVPVSYAGFITMTIAAGTIVSSFFSDKLTKKLGTSLVTLFSVLTTAIALFGFSFSHSFWALILWAIPYGLGAGAVDAALNNYVALHYNSRHMNWLHCFWGVGAAISPYIMSYYLTAGEAWNNGYRTVGILQLILTVILFISLPLWKQHRTVVETSETPTKGLSLKDVFRLRGIWFILIAFLGYSAVEQTTGLWASTFLVETRNVAPDVAAQFASYFFLGITFGRFLSGIIANRFGDRQLIRMGIGILTVGALLILIPAETTIFALVGLIIVGLGCAPIYPSIIHSTPANFGKENSQSVIGIQMAAAYVGTTFMPPLFGFLASAISIQLYPFYLLLFAFLLFFCTEKLNRTLKKAA
ncbi:MFS transporter [Enterococcus sp. HY326]|uniref:MFS transporter n=1 Tax=Enterococcus sp. HY326 TaxID=2971265 RepID=UPI00224089B8|nr:MFS transporter [Enterococcus sp. HY326]